MGWFSKKSKDPMDLLLDEQKFWRSRLNYAVGSYDAQKKLDVINEIIIGAAKIAINKDLENRLKSIEDAISDLYLTGKADDDKR